MNLIPLRKFTPLEQDLLYAICIRMRDEGSQVISLSFNDIQELCQYDRKDITIEGFAYELKNIYEKLLSITCSYTEGRKLKGFVLFIRYEIDIDNRSAEIRINPDFAYLLNDITGNFTKFEMIEFSNLGSGYSKTTYRLLKQFRSVGYVLFDIDTFRERLCVPKNYKMCALDARVLKPIMEELGPCFKDLTIKKLSKRKGRKITHIEFSFTPEDVSRRKTNGRKTKSADFEDDLERRLIEKRETINRKYEKCD